MTRPYAFVKGPGHILTFIADLRDQPWADLPDDVAVQIADHPQSIFPAVRKAQELAEDRGWQQIHRN